MSTAESSDEAGVTSILRPRGHISSRRATPCVWTLPTVYRPQGDTALLIAALRQEPMSAGTRVLDLCTGSGAVGLTAALMGAEAVSAVDISRLAVWTARLNAWRHSTQVRVVHGDWETRFPDQRFDLVTANPPYVPTPPRTRTRGRARCWNAGTDGRTMIDRICSRAAPMLAANGRLLISHSAMNDADRTLTTLDAAGLNAEVVQRVSQPFGPVLHSRARWLEAQGLIAAGERTEQLVVIRAQRR